MMTEASVAENGMSPYGLRRMHLVCGGKEPVDLERAIKAAEAEGARREDVCYLAWEDPDTGLQHLRLWWRLGMVSYPMWGVTFAPGGNDQAVEAAIGQAAKGYHRRFGQWPNRAAVREGITAPAAMQLCDANGPIELVDVIGVNWIQAGMVGVYREERETGGGEQHH